MKNFFSHEKLFVFLLAILTAGCMSSCQKEDSQQKEQAAIEWGNLDIQFSNEFLVFDTEIQKGDFKNGVAKKKIGMFLETVEKSLNTDFKDEISQIESFKESVGLSTTYRFYWKNNKLVCEFEKEPLKLFLDKENNLKAISPNGGIAEANSMGELKKPDGRNLDDDEGGGSLLDCAGWDTCKKCTSRQCVESFIAEFQARNRCCIIKIVRKTFSANVYAKKC